jgi:leucyl aminopeptidase
VFTHQQLSTHEVRMQVVIKRAKAETSKVDVLVVPVWYKTPLPAKSPVAELDTHLDGLLSEYLDSGDFPGTLNATSLMRTRGRIQAPRILLVGLGKPEEFSIDHLRQASASAALATRKLGVASMALLPPGCDLKPVDMGQAIAEGVLLGLYNLKAYKSKKTQEDEPEQDNLRELHILAAGGQQGLSKGIQRGTILAEAVTMARDLINSPGNDVNPSYLATTAQDIAKRTSLRCKVLHRADMERLHMGCLLGVAQGSTQPPVLISLEHRPKGATEAPIVLVGKGITFDSGGISIKPAANMEDMKMDMAGGAAVLGTMQALAQLDYPRRVVGLVPASENLPSGTAIKPGDILRAMSGKTVEVINTDAEGRLVLADALAYAVEKLQPACMIDLATLTGAVVIALGNHAIGMMGTDEAMMERLRVAGERSAERVWQLPLFEEYSKQIDSDFADIKNTGGREAGSITGGAFLKEFVGEIPWVHLDIAGTAWTRNGKPYIPKGATGIGIRLLVDALEAMSQPPAKGRGQTKAAAPAKK